MSSSLTSVGTLSGLTVNGNVEISDGTNDFDIASHDGSNGLKLGGTLVTSDAAELNYLDITALGTSQPNKAVTANNDGVVKVALSSSDTSVDRVGFTVSHTSTGTPAANLGTGISFEISDAGGLQEQGRVSTTMDTVTDGSEDSRIVFQVRDSGSLSTKAEVQTTRFNIASSSSYAINGANVLSNTSLGSSVVSSSLTSVGTLSGLTVNGNVEISDGTNDFDIASHDGSNGLKLGGTLVTSDAAELNYLDITALGTSQPNKAVTANNDGVVKVALSSSDTSVDRVGFTVSHTSTGTPAANLGTGISFEISDAGGLQEQGRVSTTMDTVTDGSEDSRIVFQVRDSGSLSTKAEVQTTRFNIASSSSYAINGANVLSNTSLGSSVVSSSLTSVGTLSGLTVNGNVEISDGTNDFDIASHDGSNGLKLGGTLVTSDAAELNYLDITALGTSQPNKAVTANNDGVVKVALSSSDTSVDRVGFTVSHTSTGTPAANLGTGISFEISDAGGLQEQGRVSTTMDTVTDGSEDSRIVFQVRDSGSLSTKAEVQTTRFNIASSSSYAINGANVLSNTSLGSSVVSSSLTSVGTLSGLTVNGNVEISDGTNDFDIASHDGSNGLKLGGTLVTSDAAELNYLDITALGTSQPNKAVTANNDGVVKVALSSSDTSVDRVGFTVSHTSTGTPAANLGTGISFEISDAGGLQEQGRVSTTMDTVTDGSEDSRIVFQVRDSGSLSTKAEVQTTRFNIASSSSYAINGANVLSNTSLGSSVVSSSLTSVGTLSGLTVNGNVEISDGTNDFDIASHDGSNGLKLDGVVVEATAADINLVKNGSKLSTIAGLSCSNGEVLEWLDSTWQCGTDNTRRRLVHSEPEEARENGATSVDGTYFSDRRLKSEIETIQNATEKLQSLRGVVYEFKRQEGVKYLEGLPLGQQIGVIAQEVDEVLPQIVKTNRDGIKLTDYAALSGFLVQVNKEQQLDLTQHKAIDAA